MSDREIPATRENQFAAASEDVARGHALLLGAPG